MSSVDFKFFFALSALLWWGSHYIACNSSIHGCNLCSASFLKGWNRLFREGTKVQSKNFSTCHQILESHLKEERLPLKKENGSFLGIVSALLKKSPDVAIFFKAEYCPRWRRKHWQAEKGDTWGSEAARGRGGAPRAQNLVALCWGRGSHHFGARNGSPLEKSPRGHGSPTLAAPKTPPLPVLADPTACRTAVPLRLLPAAQAQLFVCCWSFSKKKRRNRQEDGAEEGETRGGKALHFCSCRRPTGRAAFLLKLRSRPGLLFRWWGSRGAWREWGPVPPARRGEGHRGHAGHTWGASLASARGPGRVGARGGVPGPCQGGARPQRRACGGERGHARVGAGGLTHRGL